MIEQIELLNTKDHHIITLVHINLNEQVVIDLARTEQNAFNTFGYNDVTRLAIDMVKLPITQIFKHKNHLTQTEQTL